VTVYSQEYDIKGRVFKRNEKYVLVFKYNEKEYEDELLPAKKEATLFIETIARWQMEKHMSDIKMEEIYELLVKAKR